MSNRKQYVNIDGRESELLESLECSVIQGSKMSSLLYILYTNEIPLLHKIIGSDIYFHLTGQNLTQDFPKVSNMVVQYVDDSSNIITSTDYEGINEYIDKCI